MHKLVQNPHHILWVSIPFVLLVGFFSRNPLTINIYDTYLIIQSHHAVNAVVLYFTLLSLPYWLLIRSGKKLNWRMNLVHLGSTIDVLFLVWLIYLCREFSDSGWCDSNFFNWIMPVLAIAFLAGQIVFMINIALCLFRKTS